MKALIQTRRVRAVVYDVPDGRGADIGANVAVLHRETNPADTMAGVCIYDLRDHGDVSALVVMRPEEAEALAMDLLRAVDAAKRHAGVGA